MAIPGLRTWDTLGYQHDTRPIRDTPFLTRGQVEDDEDPEQRSRIKVRVTGVYDEIPVSALPWAEPCIHLGAGEDQGDVPIPPTGTWVWVMFERGDHKKPVWLGTWYGAPAGVLDTPEEFRDQAAEGGDPRGGPDSGQILPTRYRKNYGRRTPIGNLWEMDDTEGNIRITFRTPKGHYLVLFDSDTQHIELQTPKGHRIRMQDCDKDRAEKNQEAYDNRIAETTDAGYNIDQSDTPRGPDAEPEQFIEVVTANGHRIRMDDPNPDTESPPPQKITIETTDGHIMVMDDVEKEITITTKDGHNLAMQDRDLYVLLKTIAGHELRMDDPSLRVDLTTPGDYYVQLDDIAQKAELGSPCGNKISVQCNPGGLIDIPSGTMNLLIAELMTLTSGTGIVLSAPTVDLNGNVRINGVTQVGS